MGLAERNRIMITAVANADDGRTIILLGISRENINRLTAGSPIRVSAETHPGFPADLTFLVVFGETERSLTEDLKSLISDKTQIVGVPRGPGTVS